MQELPIQTTYENALIVFSGAPAKRNCSVALWAVCPVSDIGIMIAVDIPTYITLQRTHNDIEGVGAKSS